MLTSLFIGVSKLADHGMHHEKEPYSSNTRLPSARHVGAALQFPTRHACTHARSTASRYRGIRHAVLLVTARGMARHVALAPRPQCALSVSTSTTWLAAPPLTRRDGHGAVGGRSTLRVRP